MNSTIKMIRKVRKTILDVSYHHHVGHVGSALSIAGVLTVLYLRVLKNTPQSTQDYSRDRFLLSKGHASVALYSVLYHFGFIDKKTLNSFNGNGEILGEHNEYNLSLGIEYSAGSLGHGLSVGSGMALGLKHKFGKKTPPRVYVLISDAELNEGSTWESIMFVTHNKINNLCMIIDDNNSQAMGKAENVINLQPLKKKLESFGWEAFDVDSKDYSNMGKILNSVGKAQKPIALIVKGKIGEGVSFMEGNFEWRYLNLDEEKYSMAIEENKKN